MGLKAGNPPPPPLKQYKGRFPFQDDEDLKEKFENK